MASTRDASGGEGSASATGGEDVGTTTITRDDLAAALDLLTDADRSRASRRRHFWAALCQPLIVGVFLYSLTLGLVVIWVDRGFGLVLLLLAAAAFVALGLLGVVGRRWGSVYSFRKALGTDLASAADELWDRRAHHGLVGLALLVGFVSGAAGVVLLFVELVRDGDISVLAVILLAVPILTVWLPTGVQQYRELSYLSQVSAARDRLEALSTAQEEGSEAPVQLSAADYDVISRAESQQLRRNATEIASQAGDEAGPLYAVVKLPAAGEELTRLAAEAPKTWQAMVAAVDSLQADPVPPESHEVTGGVYELDLDDCRLVYSVDHDAQRVVVRDVQAEEQVARG
jgi:mRNA-degrading endonuclease RelE of RelBE toxin-antitoxin system